MPQPAPDAASAASRRSASSRRSCGRDVEASSGIHLDDEEEDEDDFYAGMNEDDISPNDSVSNIGYSKPPPRKPVRKSAQMPSIVDDDEAEDDDDLIEGSPSRSSQPGPASPKSPSLSLIHI